MDFGLNFFASPIQLARDPQATGRPRRAPHSPSRRASPGAPSARSSPRVPHSPLRPPVAPVPGVCPVSSPGLCLAPSLPLAQVAALTLGPFCVLAAVTEGQGPEPVAPQDREGLVCFQCELGQLLEGPTSSPGAVCPPSTWACRPGHRDGPSGQETDPSPAFPCLCGLAELSLPGAQT